MLNRWLSKGTRVEVPEGYRMSVSQKPFVRGAQKCHGCSTADRCSGVPVQDQLTALVFCAVVSLYVLGLSCSRLVGQGTSRGTA